MFHASCTALCREPAQGQPVPDILERFNVAWLVVSRAGVETRRARQNRRPARAPGRWPCLRLIRQNHYQTPRPPSPCSTPVLTAFKVGRPLRHAPQARAETRLLLCTCTSTMPPIANIPVLPRPRQHATTSRAHMADRRSTYTHTAQTAHRTLVSYGSSEIRLCSPRPRTRRTPPTKKR